MSRFNGFLDNLTSGVLSPKGDMGDYAHAARLYTDDNFRLAPKQKFLYHVAFNLNEEVINRVAPNWDKKHGLEVNMLVKSVSMPKYDITIETKNKYNRKKNIQTRIDYDPVTITFHDDNQGLVTQMWAAYYQYYFRDGTHGSVDGAGKPNQTARPYDRFNAYKGVDFNSDRYGLDNDSYYPFFNSIQVSQMARRQYTTMTLVNPIITGWEHDTLENGMGAEPVQSSMTVAYESVFYADGPVEEGNAPVGFAETHYDNAPSPNSAGSATSLFGSSGVLAGGGSVLSDIGSGQVGLGTIITAANTVESARDLTAEGLRNEALNVSGRALGDAAGVNVSGLSNTSFPKQGGRGSQATVAEPVATKKEIKTLPVSEIEQTFQDNPAQQQALARKMYALGIIAGDNETPPATFSQGLSDFAALSNQERQALVDETTQRLNNNDLKTVQLASEVINTGRENAGESVNVGAQRTP
jgi:hypothetical protein